MPGKLFVGRASAGESEAPLVYPMGDSACLEGFDNAMRVVYNKVSLLRPVYYSVYSLY